MNITIGALGTIPKALGKHQDVKRTNVRIDLLQKAAFSGTARILRKFVKIQGYGDIAGLEKIQAQRKM